MKRKTKVIIALAVIGILVYPVKPLYEGRPYMSHKTFEEKFEGLADDLNSYSDVFAEQDGKWLKLRCDLLTGFRGYSVVGADIHCGRSSVMAMGRIKDSHAEGLYRDGDTVWASEADLDRLTKIIKSAEQVAASDR